MKFIYYKFYKQLYQGTRKIYYSILDTACSERWARAHGVFNFFFAVCTPCPYFQIPEVEFYGKNSKIAFCATLWGLRGNVQVS